ncbi:MAG: hypothetical protein WDN10_00760 [bacterium]
MQNLRHPRGFAALISVLIICAILVSITLAVGLSSFFARADLLDAEGKAISRNLARGCVDAAILRLAKDGSYSPKGERIAVGDRGCRIESITYARNNVLVTTSAEVNGTYTILQAAVREKSEAQRMKPAIPIFTVLDVAEITEAP